MELKVARAAKPVGRPLVVRGQGAKPLYQAKDGTRPADDAARLAALIKRDRKAARRLRLVLKGAIESWRAQ